MPEHQTTPPHRPATDSDFLDAVEGYARCVEDGQEVRLSRAELERLTLLARLGAARR